MKRKILISLLVLSMAVTSSILAACGGGDGSGPEWPAMEKLQALSAGDITHINYMRATEGGALDDQTGDPTEIEDIYLRLKDVKIADKTEEAVEDDDMYISVEAGDENLEFSFMGDILILDGENYKVENLSSLKSYIDGLLESAAGPKEDQQDERQQQPRDKQDQRGFGKRVVPQFQKRLDDQIRVDRGEVLRHRRGAVL